MIKVVNIYSKLASKVLSVPLWCNLNAMRKVLFISGLVLLTACTNERCRPSIAPQPVSLAVDRIDSAFFEAKSADEVATLLAQYDRFSTLFLHSDQYPSTADLAAQLFTLLQNESLDTLYAEANEAFSDMQGFTSTLEAAFGRLVSYYPEAQIPKLQMAFTGFYNDLYISNREVIIGMDYFIGTEASYKPQQIPAYILKRYTLEHLPANIMQYVSSQFIQTAAQESLLAEMIDYGKSYYLLSKLLPCTPLHILMGYTADEWEGASQHDAIIWANFIENELLYETGHQVKQKFLAERPNVYEIGEKCPGRIGQWVGWQIVEAYVSETGVSVVDLMKKTDNHQLFRESRYKPSGR